MCLTVASVPFNHPLLVSMFLQRTTLAPTFKSRVSSSRSLWNHLMRRLSFSGSGLPVISVSSASKVYKSLCTLPRNKLFQASLSFLSEQIIAAPGCSMSTWEMSVVDKSLDLRIVSLCGVVLPMCTVDNIFWKASSSCRLMSFKRSISKFFYKNVSKISSLIAGSCAGSPIRMTYLPPNGMYC